MDEIALTKRAVDGTLLVEGIRHGDGSGTLRSLVDGRWVETAWTPPPVPSPKFLPVVEAAALARQEVSGFSETSGTRQAVEALATAVEALTQDD